jgi:hypothetical protein
MNEGFLLRKIRRLIWKRTPLGPSGFDEFDQLAASIRERRSRQNEADVSELSSKYQDPVFGEVTVYQLLEMMGQVVDPCDNRLGCASQLVHTLQGLESMKSAGIVDEDLLHAMLLHDTGKLLYLAGEAPENVFGMKRPVTGGQPGKGLEAVVFQWNHDDFAYQRFREITSEPVAWLLRYHSILIPECEPYMNDRDREYTEKYLREFQVHDQGSKSIFGMPGKKLQDYRCWIESSFPHPVLF